MKISYMLKREDFYQINQKTLNQYYHDKGKSRKLYIYPELNAIVTARPSSQVKNYLYTEFKVKGKILKKLLVFLYARTFINSKGLLSSKSCVIHGDFSDDCLIYPCNKKIRIFDFAQGTVRVVPKHGFPDDDIKREIKFRTSQSAAFIPEILSYSENEYCETIIDGYPLARAQKEYFELKETAWKIWQEYAAPTVESVFSKDYAVLLHSQFVQQTERAKAKLKTINWEALTGLENSVYQSISAEDAVIQIGLSHGDLQPGNIWIENRTQKIFIIDWEAYGTRSIWYDECTLNCKIRMSAKLQEFARGKDFKHNIVLYEDLIFRLTELNNMPLNYNSESFNEYIAVVSDGREYV